MAKDSRPRIPSTGGTPNGEGIPVPFKVLRRSAPNEELIATTGQVLFENAAAPERRFVADSFELRIHPAGFAQWLFGQTQVDGSSLRALLDVRYPLQGMQTTSALFEAFKFEAPPTSDIERLARVFNTEPAQTLAVEANLTRVSSGKHASLLDFYHSSGLGMTHAMSEAQIYVMPIVRVLLPFDLLHLISREVQAKVGSGVSRTGAPS